MSYNIIKELFNLLLLDEALSLGNIHHIVNRLAWGKNFIGSTPFTTELSEIWIIGVLIGLILVFLLLAILTKIRPYTLCGIWFIALLALYIWRSGFVFVVFPSLGISPFKDIYILILSCIPFIIFLIINKVISVMQAREQTVFATVFTISIWVCSGYLILVTMTSIINPELIILNLHLIQSLFWFILGVESLLFLVWLTFSSKKNYEFLRFQSTFGLLFLVSAGAKVYINLTYSTSSYLKPKYLLWGIAAQLIYIYWLLLQEVFQNRTVDASTNKINLEPDKPEVFSAANTPKTKEEPLVLKDLSQREMEILLAYCKGFSYRDISNSYFISPNTVKSHLKNCYLKLDINSKVEAINMVNDFYQTRGRK